MLGSGPEFSGYNLAPLDCPCDASPGGTRFVLGLAESGLMAVISRAWVLRRFPSQSSSLAISWSGRSPEQEAQGPGFSFAAVAAPIEESAINELASCIEEPPRARL